MLNFPEGHFSIRYLGIPLSPRKLSIVDYDPFIHKLRSKVQYWSSRFLGYAESLTLLKSVLLSSERFWAFVFVFPAEVHARLVKILRNFLWSRAMEGRKSSVSWSSICQPLDHGGIGIKEVLAWKQKLNE